MGKKFLILFALLSVFSCSQGGKTSSKLAITVGNLTAVDLTSYSAGGAILYGLNNSTQDKFAINLSDITGDLILELNNGEWVFSGFLWDGASAFEGNHYCAFTNSSLGGGEVSIPLSFTSANCNNTNFAVNFDTSTGTTLFPAVEIEGCRTLANISGATYNCDTGTGDESLTMSYRVSLETFSVGQTVTSGSSIISNCLDAPSTGAGVSGWRLPQGNGILPYEIVVEAFFDSACSGLRGSHQRFYPNGLMVDGIQVFSYDNAGQQRTKIFHDVTMIEACGSSTADFTTSFSTGNGSSVFPYGLCHAEQWDLIGRSPASTLSNSFELLRDLDFSHRMAGIPGSYNEPPIDCVGLGSSFVPVGRDLWVDYPLCSTTQNQTVNTTNSFQGTFDGNHHMISGAFFFGEDYEGVGLFRNVGNGAVIKNFVVSRSEVEGDNYVGMIAGYMSATSSTTFENITIYDSSIFGENNVGSLLGGDTASTGSSSVTNVLSVDIDIEGASYVGGIIGKMSAPGASLTKLYFNGSIDADDYSSGSSKIGGLVGELSSSPAYLQFAVSKGAITGNYIIAGGLVGSFSGSGGTIDDARSEMAIASNNVFQMSGEVGGLVGFTNGVAINDAFFTGSIYHECYGSPLSCNVGEISGGGTAGILTRVYSSNLVGSAYGGASGTFQSNPDMRGAAFNSANNFNNSTDWLKTTGRYPYMSWEHESPYTTNTCDLDPSYNESITNQVTVYGRGSAANPATLCHAGQFTTDLGVASAIVIEDHLNLTELENVGLTHQVTSFSGTLDGQSHVLHGFTIDNVTNTYPSLIRTNNGTLEDFALVGIQMSLDSNSGALLAYDNYGTIKGFRGFALSLESSASATSYDTVGIIAANNYGEISHGYLGSLGLGSEKGGSDIGSVVGINDGGTLTRLSVYSDIRLAGTTSNYTRVGGIAGNSDGGTIDQVSWAGQMDARSTTGTISSLGGLIGRAINSSAITNSMTEEHAAIKATNNSTNIGGLVGELNNASIGQSFHAGEVWFGYCSNGNDIDYKTCTDNAATWLAPGSCSGAAGDSDTECVGNGGTWTPSTGSFGPVAGLNSGGSISSDTFFMTPAYEIIETGHSVNTSPAPYRSDIDGTANPGGGVACTITLVAAGTNFDVDENVHGLFIDGHEHYFHILTEVTNDYTFTIDLDESSAFEAGDCAVLGGDNITFVNATGTNLADGTLKKYPDMTKHQTFCPSAPAPGSEQTDFLCAAGEWDMVGDAFYPNTANGFDYLIQAYVDVLLGAQPVSAPAWRIVEDEGLPELLFEEL